MLVKDVMNKNVATTEKMMTVKEAAKIMTQLHIGSLIVMDGEKIIGIVTERDLLDAVSRGKNSELVTIEEIMKEDVKTIEPDVDIEKAIGKMIEFKIKKLPVVREDKLVGIITCSDIAVVAPKMITNIAQLISIRIPSYSGG